MENVVEDLNGFILINHYISSEPLMLILSHLPPKDLLNASLVCKNWNRIIKDNLVWKTKYQRTYNKKPKHLPWYVYYALFATNLFNEKLLKNVNDQGLFYLFTPPKTSPFNYHFTKRFTVEIPLNGRPELHIGEKIVAGTECFSSHTYRGFQEIDLSRKLFKKILNEFKPHIYVGEWVYGNFNCHGRYVSRLRFINENGAEVVYSAKTNFQDRREQWQKLGLTINKYSKHINKIVFEHQAIGFGTATTGALLKIQFDSIYKTMK